MRREARRGLAKKMKGMSHTEVYTFVQDTCYAYGEELMGDALKALHREFGFGKDRQERFRKALHKVIEERDPKKVQP